jgi:diacylglycerol O-acyltransferase
MGAALDPLDAIFLELEDADEGAHMHIGSAAVFEALPGGGGPGIEQVRELLHRRLGRLPRYATKLSQPHTGGLQWPTWEHADAETTLESHVRHATLPSPGGDPELLEWLGDYWSHRLDRRRPLWEMVLLDGLADGRWALINKTHHCLVDGVGSVDIGHVIFDATPEAPEDEQPAPAAEAEWRENEDSDGEHGGGGLGGLVRMPPALLLRGARAGADLATHPGKIVDVAERSRAVAELLVRDELLAAPHTSLNEPLGTARRFAVVRASLAELQGIKRQLGGTVNDVVLAACAGALRRLLLSRGETPPAGMRAMVPVNLRRASEQLEMGNRVSSLFIPLPVDVEDPRERYAAASRGAAALKSGNAALGGSTILELMGLAPPVLHATAARTLFSRRLFNVTITNVPGPQTTLHAFGAPMREVMPLVPLAAGHTLGIAIVSYDGGLVFGMNADRATVPDLDVAVKGLEDSLEELRRIAGVTHAGRRTGRPARRA